MTSRITALVSDDELNQIIQIESAGKPEAKASTSSATGLGQFLNQTWLETLKKYGPPDLAARIVKRGNKYVVPDGGEREILDLRKGTSRERRKFNVDMLAAFTASNAKGLGASRSAGDLYLAHFAGLGVAKALLHGDQSDRVNSPKYFSQSAIDANKSILLTVTGKDARNRPIYDLPAKTVGQVRAWAQSSMENRWRSAGRTDWVGRYWYPGELSGEQLLDGRDRPETERPPVKVEHPDAEVLPVPHNQQTMEIAVIQQRLTDMGYFPGTIDGLWGGRTAGEIAAFKNDRHLLGPPQIDEMLKDELVQAEEEGWRRPIAAARKEATQEQLETKLPEVAASKTAERAGFWASMVTLATSVVTGATSYLGDAVGYLTPLKEFAGDVPAWVWALGGIGLAVGIYYASKKSGDAATSSTVAYQEGARV